MACNSPSGVSCCRDTDPLKCELYPASRLNSNRHFKKFWYSHELFFCVGWNGLLQAHAEDG